MTELALAAGLAAVLWVLKQVFGPLIGQEAKGSIPDYTASKARSAARRLPPGLADEYEEIWLAELEALKDKPLSALKFARGLRRAGSRIAKGSAHSLSRPRAFARVGAHVGIPLLRLRQRLEHITVITAFRIAFVLGIGALAVTLGGIGISGWFLASQWVLALLLLLAGGILAIALRGSRRKLPPESQGEDGR